MKLSAVILAGGESRRMGRDKAWLEKDGIPLIARTVAIVRELGVEEIFISGRAAVDYSALRLPVLHDLQPGLGPLGGIERGLRETTAPLLLVLAVDLAQMTSTCLKSLAAHCDDLTGAVPTRNGELEPLAAIYPRRCHAIAANCITQARRAARDFAEACHRERAVRFVSVASAFAACFANWNSPTDLPSPDLRADLAAGWVHGPRHLLSSKP
jgi:molybdopterin-guanine dinucleotide biosynthesis protein A